MRGTLHTALSQDVRWRMAPTKGLTLQKAVPRWREFQINTATIDPATSRIHDYLQAQRNASRKTLFAEHNGRGIETSNRSGIHLLMVRAQEALIGLGPLPKGTDKVAQDSVPIA